MTRIPRPLPDQGHIRIVSIAGRVNSELFQTGIKRLESRGFRVSFNQDLLDTGHPYLAAPLKERLNDLNQAILDEDVDAILCARGGFGSMHLLEKLDIESLVQSNKLFVGFSDNTALHLALNKAGMMSLHGPVVTALGYYKNPQKPLDNLIASMQYRFKTPFRFPGTGQIPGQVKGKLVGGNLSLLASCLPNTSCALERGSILLIEEIGEPLYRIDRMISGLISSGLLNGVSGVALGSFTMCAQNCGGEAEVITLLVSSLSALDCPIVSHLPIGHKEEDISVPLGLPVILDGTMGEMLIEWPCLSKEEPL
jgi:muramoyltetrapeptide carboxypeptidase